MKSISDTNDTETDPPAPYIPGIGSGAATTPTGKWRRQDIDSIIQRPSSAE